MNPLRSACPNIICRTERHARWIRRTRKISAVRHDHRDEERPAWLEVERLAQKERPAPPQNIAEWTVASADPDNHVKYAVTTTKRDTALAGGGFRPDDVLEVPPKRGE
jgi:hypothetical protein